LSVGFTTVAAVVHELIEARDEKRLLRLQRQLAGYKLLVIDELGYVPLSQTGAELLFEVFSQRYERGSTIVTSNLPFDEWTSVFASERLTGALLDRLTHHVHILEMNGDSYRPKQSKQRQRRSRSVETSENPSGHDTERRCAPWFRDVTLRSGTMPRKSIGERPMTDAERSCRVGRRCAGRSHAPASRSSRTGPALA
jgi:IstB-like ATP binding protein